MRVELLATNPRMGEWDKEFRGKNIVTLQKVLNSLVNPEFVLHPSAIFLYANDEFTLFQVVKDRPRQLAEIDKDIKSLLVSLDYTTEGVLVEYVNKCFKSREEQVFYFKYRKVVIEYVGGETICVIKDNSGTNK